MEGHCAARICRSCRHWSPLFRGEAWGVRSFIDAPDHAQAPILAKIANQMATDGYADVYSALTDYPPGISDSASSGAGDVPGGVDWPFWGECKRTELSDDGAGDSLAMAIDGSMYRAVLRCRYNFGCVQWQNETSLNPTCGVMR